MRQGVQAWNVYDTADDAWNIAVRQVQTRELPPDLSGAGRRFITMVLERVDDQTRVQDCYSLAFDRRPT